MSEMSRLLQHGINMQFLLIVGAVILFAGFLILSFYLEAKRRKELLAWAQSKGLIFSAGGGIFRGEGGEGDSVNHEGARAFRYRKKEMGDMGRGTPFKKSFPPSTPHPKPGEIHLIFAQFWS